MIVARLANTFLLNRSLYLSGITSAMFSPSFLKHELSQSSHGFNTASSAVHHGNAALLPRAKPIGNSRAWSAKCHFVNKRIGYRRDSFSLAACKVQVLNLIRL